MALKTSNPIPGTELKTTEPYDPNFQTCQQCNGTGKIFFRLNSKKPCIDCDMCNGTGSHELNALWFIQGKIIYEWRMRKRIKLRDCAKQNNIDPSNLSKMERGIIRPDSDLIKLICGAEKV